MRHILKYSFSSLLLLCLSVSSFAQVQRTVGPRIGFDVGGVVRKYFEPGFNAYTFSVDQEIQLKYYPTLEGGYLRINKQQEKLDYESDGFFIKPGLDFNVLEPKGPWDHDMIFAGMRLGLSYFEHQAQNVVITDEFWGDYELGDIPKQKLQAYWIEAVGGMRVEVVRNIFIGWSLRAKLLLYQEKDRNMSPYVIPGYGKAESSTLLGITYFISYRLPLLQAEYQP